MLRTAISPEDIQGACVRIVRHLHPEKVVLFGSYAYGDPGEQSDVDFLVVVDNPPTRQEACRLAFELGRPIPLQLVLMTPGEYESTKDIVGGLAYPAHHAGKVLYERNTG